MAAAPANPPVQARAAIPQPRSITRSDGSMVHIVQAGDTPFGIALAYGVSLDQIMQLNNLKTGDFLQIGQELLIKGPVNPPTPTPKPQQTATSAAPQPTAIAAVLAPGGLCVQAFNDRNGNGLYDGNEELVANIKFTVWAGDKEVAAYTTTGVNEPHCFAKLSPRTYMVRIESPKGYMPTTDEVVGVALVSGQMAPVSFGVKTGNSPAGSATDESGEAPNLIARYQGVALGVCGVLVLVTAGVLGFVFVSRQKQS